VAVDRSELAGGPASLCQQRKVMLVLDVLGTPEDQRFGRLILTVSDGRIVDVEVIEKIDHDVLRGFQCSGRPSLFATFAD